MFASQTQFGSTDASQLGMGMGGGAKTAKVEDKQQVLPVTIRSIETAVAARTGDSEVMFHGIEPGMLVLAGVVESVSSQAASIELSLNDSTGRIRVRQYAAESDSALAKVEAGKYILVAGQLRTSPAVHLTVMSARIVQSPDEISYHMIEAAHAALRLKRGPEESIIMPSKSVPMQIMSSPTKAAAVAAAPAAPVAAVAAAAPAVDVRAAIVAYLQKEAEAKPEGVAISAVSAALPGTAASEVSKVLGQLVDDGEAYTTLDDDHFALL